MQDPMTDLDPEEVAAKLKREEEEAAEAEEEEENRLLAEKEEALCTALAEKLGDR